MTCFLLDVNVLIALIDPAHIRHDDAHKWFGSCGMESWATCPLTENGVLRILGSPRYPSSPGTPSAIAEILATMRHAGSHQFWPDEISLLDPELVDATRLLSSGQITDTYLLALARAHGGKLATFDRHLVTDAVRDGASALERII